VTRDAPDRHPQTPATVQVNPETQSLVEAQVVLQADPVGAHRYGLHELLAVEQVPSPLQVEDDCNVEPVQVAGAQAVPAGQTAQLPAPEQTPVAPHVDADVATQTLRGLVPAVALVQVPSCPAALHCSQPPVQALSQQWPSTQKPLAQVLLEAHVAPCAKAQTLPLQEPLEQSPPTLQVLPAAQGEQNPPQSTSVSTPFFTPSKQLGTWQVPAEQTPLWQSLPAPQVFPLAQERQTPPPQSTAVSLPFFTPSMQVATWQVPAEQTPLVQSPPPTHCTHAPAPSHIVPPPVAQAVPEALGCCVGTPVTHTPVKQGPLDDGGSVGSAAPPTTWPLPSHWFDLQSPETGSETLVPATLADSPHWPLRQVAVRQGPEGAGQVVASAQTDPLLVLEPPQAAWMSRRRAATRAADLEWRTVSPGANGAAGTRLPLEGSENGRDDMPQP
jgi:hypothetical protein